MSTRHVKSNIFIAWETRPVEMISRGDKGEKSLGQVQTSNFTCAEYNAN